MVATPITLYWILPKLPSLSPKHTESSIYIISYKNSVQLGIKSYQINVPNSNGINEMCLLL